MIRNKRYYKYKGRIRGIKPRKRVMTASLWRRLKASGYIKYG